MVACPSGFYGKDCRFQCFDCPLNSCYPNNGSCICPGGWTGENCRQGQPGFILYVGQYQYDPNIWCHLECDDGFYGPNCELRCDCEQTLCNRFNGTCRCSVGVAGSNCMQGMGLTTPIRYKLPVPSTPISMHD